MQTPAQGLWTPAHGLGTPGYLAGWLDRPKDVRMCPPDACVAHGAAVCLLISKHIISGKIYLIGLDILYRCSCGIVEANHGIWPPISQD